MAAVPLRSNTGQIMFSKPTRKMAGLEQFQAELLSSEDLICPVIHEKLHRGVKFPLE